MLGWPQEAGFAFSSKNIQPLTSLDVLYSNRWSPSLSVLQPVSSWAGSSAQSRPSLAVQCVLKHSCCSDKISHPLGSSSALQLEKHMLLFHLARAATEHPPWLPVVPGGTPALQRMDKAAHSIPTAPGALDELTTSSRKLSWELKGYTKRFSGQVQTLSTILPVLQERRNHSSYPPLTYGHYSHLTAAQGSSAALSSAQSSLFQHHAPHVSLPCFPVQKPPSSPQIA